MNLLVLGSCGFIGTKVCNHFVSLGYTVTGCDLVEYSTNAYQYHKVSILSSDFETLFASGDFDICINASGSGHVGYSITHPQSDFSSNTIAVSKLLDAIRKCKPACKLLHISSAAVYGSPACLPVSEAALLAPMSPYGYHKLMSELLCKEYGDIYQVPVSIIRPFSVYGIGLKKQLLWDTCEKLKQADEINLFGTGNETRDFIHIDDLVALMQLVIEQSAFSGEMYNAACGEETSIKTIADIIARYYPGNKTINFSGNSKAGDPTNWRADVSKIRALGFSPKKILETEIKNYINWHSSLLS